MSELEKHLARKGRPYSFGHQQMYNAPIELLKKKRWDILDVGAGIGYGYEQMDKAGILANYTGIEPDFSTFRHLLSRRRHPTHMFWNQDLISWVGGGLRDHDYVFCIEVVEHVKPPEVPPFLKALRGVTRKALFLSTPSSDRSNHGVRTDAGWEGVLREAGFRSVPLTPQWTTLHVCVPV